MAALAFLLAAAPAHATPKTAPATERVDNSIGSVHPAVSCAYSTNESQGFTFNGVFHSGFGYAGHYNGLTTIPSTTQITAAGIEAQCLLIRYGSYNPGPVDGVFGNNSRAAMRQFQIDMNNVWGAGLTTDGLPGPQSWKWLRFWED